MKKLALCVCLLGCTQSNPEETFVPHALGTIVLGEAHPTGGGTSSPIVSASFIPDVGALPRCTTKLAGCEITVVPDCNSSCALGEVCVFDGACSPVCQRPCTTNCPKPEPFDAGPIAFAGTTVAITLFPPYQYTASQQGAPFLAGAGLQVQGQGAVGAGFESFDETFTATSFLQTLVALDEIDRSTLFGGGAVPIEWVPGQDQVVITVGGSGGSAVCIANDGSGRFDLPREVINSAIGDGTNLSLQVARQRKEVKKGKHAVGPLSTSVVQPEGWLELVTLSTESASFTGCGAGKQACGSGSACADLMIDVQNCGSCGVKCASSQICLAGQCGDPAMACDDCYTSAMSGKCKAANQRCLGDAECVAMRACIDACTIQSCVQDCVDMHQAGLTSYNDYVQCVCDTACTNECSHSC